MTDEAKKQKDREYRASHREEILRKRRAEYLANKEKYKQRMHDFYLANRDALLEKSQAWADQNRDRIKAASRKYYLTHREEIIEKASVYKALNPERKKAQSAVETALRNGTFERPLHCSACGKKRRVQAHHHKGYAKEFWLDVVWLCVPCHRLAHTNSESSRGASLP